MAKQSTLSSLNLKYGIAQINLIVEISLRREIGQIKEFKILQFYQAYME
ncbi:MAG: hypothetical protein JSV46_02335 [Candidatus Aminicenantes bacterium]|nr:MAG: hypothetical protein JSV46_02335 [Candidatus Aminicenantes bacterium]